MDDVQSDEPYKQWLAQRAETRRLDYPGGYMSIRGAGPRLLHFDGENEAFVVADSKFGLAQTCLYAHVVERGLVRDSSEHYRIAREVAKRYCAMASRAERVEAMRKELADPVGGSTWLDHHFDCAEAVESLLPPGSRDGDKAWKLVFGIVSAMY